LLAKHAAQVKKAQRAAQGAQDSHHPKHGMSKAAMKQAHDEMKKAAQLTAKLHAAKDVAKRQQPQIKRQQLRPQKQLRQGSECQKNR